jgi:hypothetical protein
MEAELDDSWIIEYENEEKDNQINDEKMKKGQTVLQNKIKVSIFYINTSNTIQNINEKTISLKTKGVISKEELLETINNHKINNKTKFRLISLLIFQLNNVTNDNIDRFVKTPEKMYSMKSLKKLETINLSPCMCDLVKNNTLYIFYQEDRKPFFNTKKLKEMNKKNKSRKITLK